MSNMLIVFLIVGWVLSVWGIIDAVIKIIGKTKIDIYHAIWLGLSILFILWRLVPGFQF